LTLNESAVAIRAEIMTVLASWAGLILAERADVTARPERDVRELADFVRANTDWLAGHSAGAEAVAEFRDLVRRAERVSGTEQPARVEVGPCDVDGCGQQVYARFGAGTSAEVSCPSGHVRRPDEWLLLAHGARSRT
jgi:hypothetical protein